MPLIPSTLRVPTVDGGVDEYRISDGEIHVRECPSSGGAENAEWRKLRPAELANHVEKKTIVSQWLQQRLGWRGLLRACVADRHGLYGEAASMEGTQAA
ncbi:MAG TPA: hypothetical protein VJS37_16785 [Terriglobales bacterium]|jgi:hypothetical protein|nr:hypothetical protein [Terriglobales bacterium]